MTAATTTVHRARVVWEGGKEDLRAHRIDLADRVLEASSAPELGGDAAKADPEELLVAALSTCHMLWFLSLSRERRLRVISYEDAAEGTMDGTRFTRVELRPRVEFEEEPEPRRDRRAATTRRTSAASSPTRSTSPSRCRGSDAGRERSGCCRSPTSASST